MYKSLGNHQIRPNFKNTISSSIRTLGKQKMQRLTKTTRRRNDVFAYRRLCCHYSYQKEPTVNKQRFYFRMNNQQNLVEFVNTQKLKMDRLCQELDLMYLYHVDYTTVKQVLLKMDHIVDLRKQLDNHLYVLSELHEDGSVQSKADNIHWRLNSSVTNFRPQLYRLLNEAQRRSQVFDQMSEAERNVSQVLRNSRVGNHYPLGNFWHTQSLQSMIEIYYATIVNSQHEIKKDTLDIYNRVKSGDYLRLSFMFNHHPLVSELRSQYASSFKAEGDNLFIKAGAVYHKNNGMRKLAYYAMKTTNSRIHFHIDDLLKAKANFHRVVNMPSYAHYRLSNTFLGTPEAASKLLDNLLTQINPITKAVLDLLKRDQRLSNDTVLAAWDVTYYKNLVRSKVVSIEDYLHYKDCLKGVMNICESLFGVTVREIPIEEEESWAESVIKLEFSDSKTGEILGEGYADLFNRSGKKDSGSMITLASPCSNRNQKPVIVIVTGFTREQLSFQDLRTLFHEFGHAIHQILCKATYSSLCINSLHMDWVEVPSTFMEILVQDYRVLSKFAVHYSTRQVIPESVFQEYMAYSKAFRSLHAEEHYIRDYWDLQVHLGEHNRLNLTPYELLHKICQEKSSVPIEEAGDKLPKLNYYGLIQRQYEGKLLNYITAEIIAYNIWHKYFAHLQDPVDYNAATQFRLAMTHGRSVSEKDIVKELLKDQNPLDTENYMQQFVVPERLAPKKSLFWSIWEKIKVIYVVVAMAFRIFV